MDLLIVTIAVLGFLLSAYATYVEKKITNVNYHAACDINDRISCTKAFKSGYGKTFGISNGISGMAFFALMVVLSLLNLGNIIFYFSILSLLGSIYLWYVLTFKVKTICLVCYSVYAVNIALFVISYLRNF